MRRSDIAVLTVADLARITGRSNTSIWKRCRRARKRGESIISVSGAGIYAVSLHGQKYSLVKVQADSRELTTFAKALQQHTCRDCTTTLSTVIDNLESGGTK